MGDVLKWEYMFPNTDKPLLKIPEVSDDLLEIDEENEVIENSIIYFPFFCTDESGN